jgi:pimeloyl-ACP methyl ester carboxylesterase
VSDAAGAIAERSLVVRGLRLATAVNAIPREALARAPLVVLPAAGHSWQDYRPVLERFAPERRVAAVDWPGFGASSQPAPPAFAYSALGYADLLGPWLDGLGIARPVLVGNSIGGAAAVLFALAHPERVAGLVLVAPAGFTPPGFQRAIACRLLGTPWILARAEPTLVSLYLGPANAATRRLLAARRALRHSPRYAAHIAAYAAIWRSFNTPAADLATHARALATPAIVVRGALDPVISAAAARRASQSIGARGALEVILPQAGHLPFLQQAEPFMGAVRGLLESIEIV